MCSGDLSFNEEVVSEENVAIVLKAAAVGRQCQLSRLISISFV